MRTPAERTLAMTASWSWSPPAQPTRAVNQTCSRTIAIASDPLLEDPLVSVEVGPSNAFLI